MDTDTDILKVQRNDRVFNGFRHLKLVVPEDVTNGDRLKWLWEHASSQDYAFDDFSRGKLEWFLFQLADHRTKYLEIGDHGLFIVQNPDEGKDAVLHFIMWDRQFSLHQQREPAYELLDWLFYEVKVHRITGPIPSYNKLAPRFAFAMGMKFEGELREAVLWHGKYHNVQLYGMLEKDYRDRRDRIFK
jgi:RimJ/RimL family protein N-acetyltransferase